MFPGHYSEIFGLGERLGCVLNLVILLTLSRRIFEFASMSIYASSGRLFFVFRGGPEKDNIAPWYMGLFGALAQP